MGKTKSGELVRLFSEMKHGEGIYIEGSTSTRTLNGFWWVRDIDLDERTFRIGGIKGLSYGERTITDHTNNVGAENNLQWRRGPISGINTFVPTTDGIVVWGHRLGE